jgi:nucleotide-binding universal stress UspA family protein
MAERPVLEEKPLTTSRCIVVGYDGSPSARRALRWATDHAGDARVVVAHAFEPPHDWLGHPNYDRVLQDHRARGQSLLDELPQDPRVETELLAGPAAETIARVATERGAEEIVVGSRGFGPVRAALGSVSHALLHLADRPVVVIPSHADGDETR